ncbi:hypothetical protein F2Q69_00025986 [Brassica cretica]|nr:hypothetical protein F2Q69_00025986 [Brassica cretica]
MDESEKMISGLKNMVEPVNGVEAVRSWSPGAVSGVSGGAMAAVAVVAVAGAAVVLYVYRSKKA